MKYTLLGFGLTLTITKLIQMLIDPSLAEKTILPSSIEEKSSCDKYACSI